MFDQQQAKEELLKFMFFPEWVVRAATFHGKSLVSLVEINELYSFLSVEDIAVIFVLNEHMTEILKDETPIKAVINNWSSSSIFLHSVEPILPSARQVVKDRLFDESLKRSDAGEPFRLFELTKNTVGIYINPGFFVGQTLQEDALALQRAILKRLLPQEPVSRLANRPVFENFFNKILSQA